MLSPVLMVQSRRESCFRRASLRAPHVVQLRSTNCVRVIRQELVSALVLLAKHSCITGLALSPLNTGQGYMVLDGIE